VDGPRANEPPLAKIGAGRYLLGDRLGTGGMASVWLAFDDRLGVWRAAKLLHPELAIRPKLRQRFENEARTLALLEHQNIVRVYDVGADAGIPWLVMELLQGGSPEDWVSAERPLPPRMAVGVVLAACAGLAVAHDRGVVHRDVKPSNILFGTDGTPKVSDFGIARAQDSKRGLTRAGTAMGTLAFMAPEQQTDATSVDHRADVFAIGATLYNLATAKTSFKLSFADEEPRVLRHLHSALRPVVARACRFSREDRYPDMRSLAADLEALLPLLPSIPPGLPPLFSSEAPVREHPIDRAHALADATTLPPATDPSDAGGPYNWANARSILPPADSSLPPATPAPAPPRLTATPATVTRSAVPSGPPRSATPDPPRSATPDPPRSAAPDPPRSAAPDPPRSAAPDPRSPSPSTPRGPPGPLKTLSVEIPPRIRLTVELPCEPRKRIDDDLAAATAAIHRLLQERPACAAAASAARRGGTPPEATQIRLGAADPVPFLTLTARYERLERHAHLCYGCAARVEDRDWGCVVELPVPLPGPFETRLVERVQTGESLGARVIAETLDGDRIKGVAGARMRQQGKLALREAPSKLHSKWLFLSRHITGDDLVEALFAPAAGFNDPLHCLGLLIGLGALVYDGIPPERLGQGHFAQLAALKTVEQRRELTRLATSPEDPPLLEALLRALRTTWILHTSLTVAL
jgi:serine/threonine protein kinase